MFRRLYTSQGPGRATEATVGGADRGKLIERIGYTGNMRAKKLDRSWLRFPRNKQCLEADVPLSKIGVVAITKIQKPEPFGVSSKHGKRSCWWQLDPG